MMRNFIAPKLSVEIVVGQARGAFTQNWQKEVSNNFIIQLYRQKYCVTLSRMVNLSTCSEY